MVELNPFRPSGDIHTSSLGTVEEPLMDNSNRFEYLNLEMEEQAEVNMKGLSESHSKCVITWFIRQGFGSHATQDFTM